MRRNGPVIAVLCLLFPLAILAQHGGRHGTSSGTPTGTTAPAEDPDIATFNHAIAVQASETQGVQFRLMVKSTEAARQQAQELQSLSSTTTDSIALTHKATGLQVSVDEAQSENRAFRRSLSDSQEAGLKTLTKKLTKSDAAVSKSARSIAQQVDQGTLDSKRLASAAANLEKELVIFQADQFSLGKEMGIESH